MGKGNLLISDIEFCNGDKTHSSIDYDTVALPPISLVMYESLCNKTEGFMNRHSEHVLRFEDIGMTSIQKFIVERVALIFNIAVACSHSSQFLFGQTPLILFQVSICKNRGLLARTVLHDDFFTIKFLKNFWNSNIQFWEFFMCISVY